MVLLLEDFHAYGVEMVFVSKGIESRQSRSKLSIRSSPGAKPRARFDIPNSRQVPARFAHEAT